MHGADAQKVRSVRACKPISTPRPSTASQTFAPGVGDAAHIESGRDACGEDFPVVKMLTRPEASPLRLGQQPFEFLEFKGRDSEFILLARHGGRGARDHQGKAGWSRRKIGKAVEDWGVLPGGMNPPNQKAPLGEKEDIGIFGCGWVGEPAVQRVELRCNQAGLRRGELTSPAVLEKSWRSLRSWQWWAVAGCRRLSATNRAKAGLEEMVCAALMEGRWAGLTGAFQQSFEKHPFGFPSGPDTGESSVGFGKLPRSKSARMEFVVKNTGAGCSRGYYRVSANGLNLLSAPLRCPSKSRGSAKDSDCFGSKDRAPPWLYRWRPD